MSAWDWDLDFDHPDPLVRHTAHQTAKGREPLPDPDVLRKQARERGAGDCPRCREPLLDVDGFCSFCSNQLPASAA